jgi:hypothetical protein
MVSLVETLTIRRTPAEVFAFLTGIDNFQKWQEGIVAVEALDPGPWRVGLRIKTVHKFLFWNNLQDFSEIEGLETDRRIANAGTAGRSTYREEFSLEDIEGHTRLTYRADVTPGGIFVFIEPLAAWAFKSQMRRSLGNLKRWLEKNSSVMIETPTFQKL